MQSHLVVLAEGGTPSVSSADQPDLSAFLASLSSAWRSGEVRPTHSVEAKPRYLRRIQTLVHGDAVTPRRVAPPSEAKIVTMGAQPVVSPDRPPVPKLDPEVEQQCEIQRKELARLHIQRRHAFTLSGRWCAAGLSHGRTSTHPSCSMNCAPNTLVASTAANSTPLSIGSDSGVTMRERGV
jgi:hypothetical protein